MIVGATAIELGDLFALPVHGVVPGPMLHALAAETLARDVVPVRVDPAWILLGLFGFMLLMDLKVFQRTSVLLPAAGATIFCCEAAAQIAFSRASLVVPTAAIYPSLLVFCTWTLVWSLKLKGWVILRQQREVETTSDLLQQVFQDSFDAIVLIDKAGNVRMHSREASRLFGEDEAGALMLPSKLRRAEMAAIEPESRPPLQCCEVCVAEQRLYLEFSLALSWTMSEDKSSDERCRIASMSIRNVTEQKRQERKIAYLSNHDPLTGAFRREVFTEFLGLRTEANEPFSVIAPSLDRFKAVNVVLGRNVGDELLRMLVDRIQSAGLNVSFPARLGGNTFAIFTEGPTPKEGAPKLAAELRTALSRPYDLKGTNAHIGITAGFSSYEPGSDIAPEALLPQAEEALDASRRQNSGMICAYDPQLSKRQLRSRQIERSLSQALESGESRSFSNRNIACGT